LAAPKCYPPSVAYGSHQFVSVNRKPKRLRVGLDKQKILSRHGSIAEQFNFRRPTQVKAAWGGFHHCSQSFVSFERASVDHVLGIGDE
jgi:hypothetical protein